MSKLGAVHADLDDSRVVSIHREPGGVTVELEQRRDSVARQILIRVTGVSKEIAEYYVGHKVTAPHPNPASPLDYVEYAQLTSEYLELQGYLNNDSWYLWRIVGTHIEISPAPDELQAT